MKKDSIKCKNCGRVVTRKNETEYFEMYKRIDNLCNKCWQEQFTEKHGIPYYD